MPPKWGEAMDNDTMLQCFEWYLPDNGLLWRRLAASSGWFQDLGVTQVWLPPAYKGAHGPRDVGYSPYDLYDLGEFDQKGSVRTKYGTKADYIACVGALQARGIQVFADVVFNHRMGADKTEPVMVVPVDPEDRTREIGPAREIDAWMKFTFPGRKKRYSAFQWDHRRFTGTDWDERTKTSGVFRVAGKQWDTAVDRENVNYDYLMGANVDIRSPEVFEELVRWGVWYARETGVDGFRLDAVKHINFPFFARWLKAVREQTGKRLPAVGEYWTGDVEVALRYLEQIDRAASLFDVPLHQRMYQASRSGGQYDMGALLNDTLATRVPELAVTFVDNHDTQPDQALFSYVDNWFRPLAYALILLMEQGTPCVFWGDLYGIPHSRYSPVEGLEMLMRVRRFCAYGPQRSYFDDRHVVGFTREGDDTHPLSGLAVVLTDGAGGEKAMSLGPRFAGAELFDITEHSPALVKLDQEGQGVFPVGDGNVSVYLPTNAYEAIYISK